MKKTLLVLLLISFFIGLVHFAANINVINNDDYFNLSIGRYILENRELPTKDVFTWLGQEKDFQMNPYQWLYGVWIYKSYQLGGWLLTRCFNAIIVAFIFFLLGYFIYEKTKNTYFSIIGMILISIFSFTSHHLFLQPRPQTFTILLLLFSIVLLEKTRKVWLLVLINILAFNWHSGIWPFMLLIETLYILYLKIDWKKISIVWLSVLVTPFPLKNLFLPFNFITAKNSIDYIQEWLPLWNLEIFKQRTSILIVFLFLILLFLICVNWKNNKQESMVLLILLFWFATSIRMMIFGLFFLLPFLLIISYEHLIKLFSNVLLKKIFIGVLALVFLSMSFGNLADLRWKPLSEEEIWDITDYHFVSSEMIEYIKDNDISRLFNYNFAIGGQLDFMGIQPMYDNRDTAFKYNNKDNYDYIAEYAESLRSYEGIRYILETYDIEYALFYKSFEKGLKENNVLKNSDKIIFEDENYILVHIDI